MSNSENEPVQSTQNNENESQINRTEEKEPQKVEEISESKENEEKKSEISKEKEEEKVEFIKLDPQSFRDRCSSFENVLKNESEIGETLEKCIEISKESTKIILDSRNDMTETKENSEDDEYENAVYLLKTGLPKWIPCILQRADIPRDAKPLVLEFLKLFVDISITVGLVDDVAEQIHGLVRIYLHTSPFYYNSKNNSGEKAKKEEEKIDENKEKEANSQKNALFKYSQKPEGTSVASSYFELIDQFGKKCGFQVLLQKLEGNASLGNIRVLLRIVSNMKNFLCLSFMNDFAPRCHQTVFSSLLKLAANEFNKDDKVLVSEIGDMIQGILLTVWPDAKLEEAIDRFNLDVAFTNFTSVNLERKLRGIKFIRKMVLRAESSKDGMPVLEKFLLFKVVQMVFNSCCPYL
eukprot:TRINITY_DN3429_c0_g1_i3.p1 TRINITY_DN3429_c0_g1~~TRINITY_DN3429_c0_g1_i3.p1  ORF type:complete len:408 (-),score=98.48 TRINITY_DN3429_c0_g1_i3:149-1372(-)